MKFVDLIRTFTAAAAVAALMSFGAWAGVPGWNRLAGGRLQVDSTRLADAEWVATLAPVNFVAADKTLVLFVSTACQYCVDSMAFYRALLLERVHTKDWQLVIVGTEPVQALKVFASNHNVVPDQVTSIALSTTKIRSVPTLLVVDRAKRVEHAWAGELTTGAKAKIRTIVTSGG